MTSLLEGAVRHPKIYVWTTEEHATVPWQGGRDGTGLVVVGYTDRHDVNTRIVESRGKKDPLTKPHQLLMTESAVTDDGQVFMDHDVHRQLKKAGVHPVPDPDGGKTEWFEATADEVAAAIKALKTGTTADNLRPRADFPMRQEQKQAVEQTAAYFETHAKDGRAPHFLWNAKMRFGKTFTTYQLAKRMGWTRVLVLTYKPAVESAWRDDLEGHVDFEGWRFKGKDDDEPDWNDPSPVVWFTSFQDVLGTDDSGQPKVKNTSLYLVEWDAVVIDEYHFGAWRDAARSLYVKSEGGDDNEKKELDTPDLDEDFRPDDIEEELELTVGHFLYLSGTPFRAITEGEFLEDQVFNWTYADEQRAKETRPGPGANPYAAMPKMHLLAYRMPDKLREVALNNRAEFSLTEFFSVDKDTGRFVHETEVQKWLDLLRGQDITGLRASVNSQSRPPLPFEDTNLLRALQHTVWYLPSIAACKAMADLLTADHNTFFRDYEAIVAAGAGAGIGHKALPPVERKIGDVPQDTKTITLSCGKLMTGVTVPAWAGILMLRELKSPETYFQAAFRVQSPWRSTVVDPVEGGRTEVVHKEQCYVIDFSPNRSLSLIVDYATRLRAAVASERDDEAAVEEFLEFLPVLAFDGFGMSQLRAADVIDHLTRGISASMLARRWNSSELITLDMAAMETLLADPELLEQLEQIEMFRNITDDLTAMISTNKELKKKKVANDKLDPEERKAKKEADKRRAGLKERLQRFMTRIPAFMYLTDDREKNIKDIILQIEPDLFEKVTGLTLDHFGQLVDAGVFNDSKMNDAVWKFRQFETPSLSYGEQAEPGLTGGWTQARDERFAALVDTEVLRPGDLLTADGVEAVVTDDYGIAIGGIRHASPDEAAEAITGDDQVDGWAFWHSKTADGPATLQALAQAADS